MLSGKVVYLVIILKSRDMNSCRILFSCGKKKQLITTPCLYIYLFITALFNASNISKLIYVISIEKYS